MELNLTKRRRQPHW